MDILIAIFNAPHWIDAETMQIESFPGTPLLSKLQLPVAHLVADELRGKGFKVGESVFRRKGCFTETEVQVNGKALSFSVGWIYKEKHWEIALWPEWTSEPPPNHENDLQELEGLRQMMDEIMQRDPRISHIEWHKEEY
jgi:hypothetical protein